MRIKIEMEVPNPSNPDNRTAIAEVEIDDGCIANLTSVPVDFVLECLRNAVTQVIAMVREESAA